MPKTSVPSTIQDMWSPMSVVSQDRFHCTAKLCYPSRLVHTAAYGSNMRLYELTSAASSVLQGDFIEV